MALIERSTREGIATLTLNRPGARNALSRALIAELAAALDDAEHDDEVAAVVLTGAQGFCAGADIAEMRDIDLATALSEDFCGCCDRLARCAKPLIAAVEGFAIGGGCELIEMCDLVVAADNAKFGHPEIALGTLSGAGGTQRLARAVGRARAMDLILTGRLIDAAEAERIGLISRVVAAGTALSTAQAAAAQIAAHPRQAVRFAKQAVDRAVSVGLADGLALERRLFHLSFATGEMQPRLDKFVAGRRPRSA